MVNLYPFEETINKSNCTLAEAIENIDIGGPSMLRSSAKNFHDVAVIINPSDYNRVLKEMRENKQILSDSTRLELATKVFQLTSRYDSLIHLFLQKQGPSISQGPFVETLNMRIEKVQDLRYGENPHQKAAFYRDVSLTETSVSNTTQLPERKEGVGCHGTTLKRKIGFQGSKIDGINSTHLTDSNS